jgi:energy-coupling factor transporter transmembrane protein EcfT
MPDMTENQKKAFDFASDLVKQIMTLSVAVITLAVGNIDTLSKYGYQSLVTWIFILFILSIFFGLFALMNLTGNLDVHFLKASNKIIDAKNVGRFATANEAKAENERRIAQFREKKKNRFFRLFLRRPVKALIKKDSLKVEDLSIYSGKIRSFTTLTVLSFAIAMGLTTRFAIYILKTPSTKESDKSTYIVNNRAGGSLIFKTGKVDSVFVK